jgi:hypothetical protein
MHRILNTGRSHRPGKLWHLLAWGALGIAGCSSTHFHGQDNPGDPILGERPDAPARPTTPASGSTAQGLPPIPTNGGTTNAALASQSTPGLAITSGDGWARKTDGVAPPAAGTYKPVSQPRVEAIPKETSSTPVASPIQPTAWTSGSPPTYTTDQLEAMLRQAGVIGHRQESTPDGRVKVTCVVQTSQTTTETLETTGVDYPTAVQAVIREIESRRLPR